MSEEVLLEKEVGEEENNDSETNMKGCAVEFYSNGKGIGGT